MTLPDLLNNQLLQLPLKRDRDFCLFIKDIFVDYVKLIEEYNGELEIQIKERIPTIKTLIVYLNDSVDHYYRGEVFKAYENFNQAMLLISDYLVKRNDGNLILTYTHLIDDYYKARICADSFLEKQSMFIRPFEDREKIETYRYSIPGLPCLYLSNSILTCWYELGEPNINSLQISRFRGCETLKKIDFTWNANYFLAFLNDSSTFNKELIINYLTYFPLHAACTVCVQNRTSVFKPEYIFPQFFMQWIRENQFDAIEYMSTQVNYQQLKNDNLKLIFKNIAIPAQTNEASGICKELKRKLSFTNPISWENLTVSYPQLKFPPIVNTEINAYQVLQKGLNIELIKEQPVFYMTTKFGILQDFLCKHMNIASLEPNDSIN